MSSKISSQTNSSHFLPVILRNQKNRMSYKPLLLPLIAILLLFFNITVGASRISFKEENGVQTAVYLSPPIMLTPGLVANKYFENVDFPRGHIAIKDLTSELVDEWGNSVSLFEAYFHHWTAARYYYLQNDHGVRKTKFISAPNSGPCQYSYAQMFGFGSETRRTNYSIPDPFGIEAGNPDEIPTGYEERWYLNIHVIDLRGAVDKIGCTECRCNLYNVTRDESGKPLAKGYVGGTFCCYEGTKCRVKRGFQGIRRAVHMKYTVKWVDWVDTLVPARVYILDVTDNGKREQSERDLVEQSVTRSCGVEPGCQVEYDVPICDVSDKANNNGCVHTQKSAKIVMQRGGYVVFGVTHQHAGAIGAAVFGQDGRMLCSSQSIHGNGTEIANEKGFVVGMTTCRPQPGSVKIADGEEITLESYYDNTVDHVGVMGNFYMLLVDSPTSAI